MPGDNLFDYVNFYAEFGFSYEDYEIAYNKVIGNCVIGPEGRRAVDYKAYEMFGIVEHEFFHCRNLCSTTLGFALFSLRQRIALNKSNLLQNLDLSEVVKHCQKNENNLLTYIAVNSAKLGNNVKFFVDLSLDEAISGVLNEFSRGNVKLLHELRKSHPSGWQLLSSDNDEHFSLLVNILEPDNAYFDAYKQSASLFEIVEGLAIWKEYACISQMLWLNDRSKFHDYTRKWLKTSSGRPMYRRAVDLILAATGCNMSMAMPGVILDLALCAPCWSIKALKWEEVHPSLRLGKILSVVDRLPKKYFRPDNIELVDADYYGGIEKEICTLLGWESKKQNLHEALTAIGTRQKLAKLYITEGPYVDLLALMYEPRFLHGMLAEYEHPGTQLFPWNNKFKDVIGTYTRPTIAIFKDKMIVSKTDGLPEILYLLHIEDIVITLYVNSLIDTNIFPFKARSGFDRAKSIYARRKSAFTKEEWESLKVPDLSFDSFIENKLKIKIPQSESTRRKNKNLVITN